MTGSSTAMTTNMKRSVVGLAATSSTVKLAETDTRDHAGIKPMERPENEKMMISQFQTSGARRFFWRRLRKYMTKGDRAVKKVKR